MYYVPLMMAKDAEIREKKQVENLDNQTALKSWTGRGRSR